MGTISNKTKAIMSIGGTRIFPSCQNMRVFMIQNFMRLCMIEELLFFQYLSRKGIF